MKHYAGLAWNRLLSFFVKPALGGVARYNGTLASLLDCYCADPISPYQSVRPVSQRYYRSLCKRLKAEHGTTRVTDINFRKLKGWHQTWRATGHVGMTHALFTMLRISVRFGATILENKDCVRVALILADMRIEVPKPRTQRLTAAQIIAVRVEAHKMGIPSLALAQAAQFEFTFRQRDVIGEYEADVWGRGLRWEEIDAEGKLRHVTSKKQKIAEIDLSLAPMFLEELAHLYSRSVVKGKVVRSALPAEGPMIVSERTGRPWRPSVFREAWRKMATAAGVPRTVQNMDTRAGAITEATDAGVSLEAAAAAATHSNVKQTQAYSRNQAGKAAESMKMRVASRPR